MFHYNFTNDLRISTLDESLKKALEVILGQREAEDKSESNNVAALKFYFNLVTGNRCMEACLNGDTRKVVINFMKKFQFPNPHTKDAMEDDIEDGILLAPIRTTFRLLVLLAMIDRQNAFLTRYEIAYNVFFNVDVAKTENPNLVNVANQIILDRADGSASRKIPSDEVLEGQGNHWAACDRQLREMMLVMAYSGCVKFEDIEGQPPRLVFCFESLSEQNKADIFDILSYDKYWEPINGASLADNKQSYSEYMDLDSAEVTELKCGKEHDGIIPKNFVIYGTPGCGKSFAVENEFIPKIGPKLGDVVRTTFFPDYTNVDFVGQILPKVSESKEVTYEFNPGPFTIALEKALQNEKAAEEGEEVSPVVLVIEELNRGNAASIFGDIFQLLDRNESGASRYPVRNPNIEMHLKKCGIDVTDIRIPSNLYLLATMNTSDQNVFKLDNAFKRRWEFKKISNTFKDEHPYKNYLVPGAEDENLTWEELVEAINQHMLSLETGAGYVSEDKQIGVYFVDKKSLISVEEKLTLSNEQKERRKERFKAKLFEYLWDDVAKYDPKDWFQSDINSLDKLLEEYTIKGERVFSDELLNTLKKPSKTEDTPESDATADD